MSIDRNLFESEQSMRLTKEECRQWGYGEEPDPPHKTFDGVAEEELFMDSHGLMIVLVVLKHRQSGGLYGFLYERSSEEAFFDNVELLPLMAESVVVTKYSRSDGKPWVE